MRKPRALATLTVLALLSGCLLVPRFAPPQLSVVDVQVLSAALWEQKLRVRVRVQNPNERSLAVQRIEYTLEVEGEPLASGVSVASFVVPALGEAQFDMDVTSNLAPTLLKLLGRAGEPDANQIAYRLRGRVSLAGGLLRSLPFEQSGSFTIR